VGQKVNPIGFRIGVYRDWDSKWFARDSYADLFFEDLKIRKYIEANVSSIDVDRIEIEKTGDTIKVIIFTANPGSVIGKGGKTIDYLRRQLGLLIKRANVEVSVQEVKNPELSATIVAKNIADQLVKRSSFKKVMKKAANSAIRAGAKGVKIRVAGRLDGAEIARDEWIRIGSTPLHTLRSNIDYGFAQAKTTYGIIGVKVWICKGDYNLEQR
jgi:small subunit ribosomal protein S3